MTLMLRSRLLTGLFLLAFLTSVQAVTSIDELNELPPGDQFRQLSLILMISGGAEPAMLAAMQAPGEGQARSTSNIRPDDYKTPLIRIVDQESMLSGAAYLLNFAQGSRNEIEAKLKKIDADNPILISMVDLSNITEDAIIIRNAIADAIGYSDLIDDPIIAAHLNTYRIRTIRIREATQSKRAFVALDKLTADAIQSVGGKLDAYQRMFDEEVDSKEFDREFDAAEYIQNRTDKFNEKAGILTEEIMKNVILQQSKPTKP